MYQIGCNSSVAIYVYKKISRNFVIRTQYNLITSMILAQIILRFFLYVIHTEKFTLREIIY